jgi:hypothetical protein
MLCHINGDKIRFWSRNAKDLTSKFPNLVSAARKIGVVSAIIDGEVVIFEPDGRSSFQKLQHAMGSGRNARLSFAAFDLIHLDDGDRHPAYTEVVELRTHKEHEVERRIEGEMCCSNRGPSGRCLLNGGSVRLPLRTHKRHM